MQNNRRVTKTRLLSVLISVVIVSACSLATPEVVDTPDLPDIPAGVIYINPTIDLGEINPLIYGVNHGPWAVITEKTLPLAQNAGISMIRFPGGDWGDENDLQAYHIDQFIYLAEQLGSQVSLNVRLFNSTPEKAAALVRYANIEKNYNIKYWGIGNEPTLFATARGVPNYGVDQFNEEWRTFAQALKAVDDSILLIGPELHQFGPDIDSTPKDPFGKDWMREFLLSNGDLVDVVSIHRYPFPQTSGGRAATIGELSAASTEWDEIIPYLRSLILETTGRDIPIAVTEINSHWSNAVGGEASPDSFFNAIWWADVLGRMIFNRVDIVNYFTLQSHPSTGGYGLFSRSDPRPTYYVFKMYQHFGDVLVFSGCQEPQIGIYAALDQDDVLTVMLINLGEDDITRPLLIEGEERRLIEVRRFDETHLAEPIETGLLGGLEGIMLPKQSVTFLKLK
jgi:hypothetical protein